MSVVAYGSALVRRGHLSAGQLASFTMYSGLAGMGLAGLARALASDWQTPAWRLLQLTRRGAPAGQGAGQGRAPAGGLQGAIAFRGVGFAYPSSAKPGAPPGPAVLKNFDLEVRGAPACQRLAPRGHSCGWRFEVRGGARRRRVPLVLLGASGLCLVRHGVLGI